MTQLFWGRIDRQRKERGFFVDSFSKNHDFGDRPLFDEANRNQILYLKKSVAFVAAGFFFLSGTLCQQIFSQKSDGFWRFESFAKRFCYNSVKRDEQKDLSHRFIYRQRNNGFGRLSIYAGAHSGRSAWLTRRFVASWVLWNNTPNLTWSRDYPVLPCEQSGVVV